ncbi:MAG TPA: c-type cytochrome [Burkholderiales bacterium]|nr:c-type cytochrome [Burkholderiales bacterium]
MRGLALVLALFFSAESLSVEKEVCFGCHGQGGASTAPLTPSLGGQPSFFVVAQLFLFRDGRRSKAPTPMDAFAQKLSNDDLRAYGELFARLPPPTPPESGMNPARLEKGRALVQKSNCAVCHNPDFSGRDQMPRLANQREDYLLKAMRDYKADARIGYGSATMPEELAGLSDLQLGDIAHYLAHYRKSK